MKKILLMAALLFSATSIARPDNSRWVNPFIGTGAVDGGLSGNNYPGATVPFGMVQLSPDTREAPDWAQASGYDYNDTHIYGFSHTRLSGTGASDLIDLLVMPLPAPVDEVRMEDNIKSAFSHEKEQARPGYYSVCLDNGVQAELTATARCGVHRYTFAAGSRPTLLVDLDHSAGKGSWNRRVVQSQLRLVDAHTVEGYRVITGWAKLRKVYFSMKFSRPVAAYYVQDGGRKYKETPVVNGTCVRGVYTFGGNEPVEVSVGLSPVSVENARQNLADEVGRARFDEVAARAAQSWQKELGCIDVEGTDEEKTIFYTALYHTFIQPNVISDVNGDYMAPDYTVRNSGQRPTYTTFSLWDTYRAAHPLYTLLQPVRTAHFAASMIDHFDRYGYLPIWHLWGQDNYCMIGNHSIPVLADAVLKEVPGIDAEHAYRAMRGSSTISHPNSPFDLWEEYGYMPEDKQSQSVSITLEMAFDDWCVAQVARKLGKTADYEYFMKRAGNYRNVFDADSRFFRGRNSDGKWVDPFDPYGYGANGGNPYTEGNAWQWAWYVPQDVPALIALYGGQEAFARKLDTFFTDVNTSGAKNDNASGFVGQYAHGNEPSHHVAYLYNYAGQPHKTQQYVAHIARTLYNTSSSGYAGNDDCGEMSAWYIFSALGFYPVNPASGTYVIGTPVLEKAVLHLPGGKTFTVEAPRRSEKDIYIQSAKLNGKPLKVFTLQHADIMAGGTLTFVMGSKPSKWGTK